MRVWREPGRGLVMGWLRKCCSVSERSSSTPTVLTRMRRSLAVMSQAAEGGGAATAPRSRVRRSHCGHQPPHRRVAEEIPQSDSPTVHQRLPSTPRSRRTTTGTVVAFLSVECRAVSESQCTTVLISPQPRRPHPFITLCTWSWLSILRSSRSITHYSVSLASLPSPASRRTLCFPTYFPQTLRSSIVEREAAVERSAERVGEGTLLG